MKVRAKFKCMSVTKDHTQSELVKLSAVNAGGNSSDNAQWAKYTPSGELTMTITAEGAIGAFEAGRSYFLDFTPADAPST